MMEIIGIESCFVVLPHSNILETGTTLGNLDDKCFILGIQNFENDNYFSGIVKEI